MHGYMQTKYAFLKWMYENTWWELLLLAYIWISAEILKA